MNDRAIHLKLPSNASASIDAYAEYKRIVGGDDNGRLFTQQEYDAYKKKVIPQRLNNRLYVSWTNKNNMDCKLIGPETLCFCEHRFKQHQTDFDSLPTHRPILLPCNVIDCPCETYHYLPKAPDGGNLRCSCKHTTDQHDVIKPYNCRSCDRCTSFKSSMRCGCGVVIDRHQTRVQTAEERQAQGKPLGMASHYKGMGGITGYSSLLDGYERLDPSGIGDVLGKELESSSHHIDKYFRKPDESELDFYERRHQEKMKEEKEAKRQEVIKKKAIMKKKS